MSLELTNVILAGGNGQIGSLILSALLSEPAFKVTILSRASSTAKFPAHIPVKKVSDEFTVAELTEAFKGHDAVVLASGTDAVTVGDLRYRLVDAAVAAGVKRLIPSEFGPNTLNPVTRKLVPFFDAKGELLEYVQKKAGESQGSFTWTTISTGSWLDWVLKNGNIIHVDVKQREATIWDSGSSRFSATTVKNAALAVARVLHAPSETANKQVFLTDFTASTREIIAAIEKETGDKVKVEEKQSGPELKSLKEKYDAGEHLYSQYGMLALGLVSDVDGGFNLPRDQQIWNDKLGLPKVTLEDVVREAVQYNSST